MGRKRGKRKAKGKRGPQGGRGKARGGGAAAKRKAEAKREAAEAWASADPGDHLARLVATKHFEQAAALLDERWPGSSDGALASSRMAVLLRHWPARAAEELGGLGKTALVREETATLVAKVALTLPDETVEAIGGLSAPWVADLLRLREASALLAAGEDEAAAKGLRAIGVRSPFREGRLFLRGLAAVYRRKEDEARRAMEMLRASAAYGSTASAILAMLESPDRSVAQSVDSTAVGFTSAAGAAGAPNDQPAQTAAAVDPDHLARVLEAFGDRRRLEEELLHRVRLHLRAGNTNRGLREVASAGLSLKTPFGQGLVRDLAASLLLETGRPKEVIKRLRRALPRDPSDPGRHRLRALLAEQAGELESATDHWIDHSGALDSRPGELDRQDRALYSAALFYHLGQLLEKLDDMDDAALLPMMAMFGPGRDHGELDDALESYDLAVLEDPGELEHWRSLHALSGQLSDGREADRVLERWVKHFPDHPETLLLAAEAAHGRRAFDKGLRYARRAIAQEPLNRASRLLESRLLLGKARKKLAAGHAAQAEALLVEAAAVPDLSADGLLRAQAEQAAALTHLGRPDDALAARGATLGSDARPWLWAGYYLLAYRKLQPKPRGPRRRSRVKSPPLDVIPRDDPPPAEQELATLLALVDSTRKIDGGSSAARTTPLDALAEIATEAGGEGLTELPDLKRAIGELTDKEALLHLAEHAQQLHPTDVPFLWLRYQMATSLALPTAYFARARDEIETALAQLQHPKPDWEGQDGEPADREAFDPAALLDNDDLLAELSMLPMQAGALSPWMLEDLLPFPLSPTELLLLSVWAQIRQYLRTRAPTSRRKGRSKGRRSTGSGRRRSPRDQSKLPF